MLETGIVSSPIRTVSHINFLSVANHPCVRAARELTLEAAQSASSKGSRSSYSSRGLTVSHIKKLLDSRNDREVLDGMRRVISVWTIKPVVPALFGDTDSDILRS